MNDWISLSYLILRKLKFACRDMLHWDLKKMVRHDFNKWSAFFVAHNGELFTRDLYISFLGWDTNGGGEWSHYKAKTFLAV